MEKIDVAIKVARDCHTKLAWEAFLLNHGDLLATSTQSRLVTEVFRKLCEDPQSLNYNPELWGKLLQGSISCWNLELGCSISHFVKKILNPSVSVPAAQVLLEGGHPSASREYAQRALKSSGATPKEKLQLELIVASSFAEEGKIDRAVKVLDRIGPLIKQTDLTTIDRASFLNRLGRLHYFTGRYSEAADSFVECAPLCVELHDWEGAARAYFNIAACFQNGGCQSSDQAFRMVEECRRISIEHDLPGPLSHCESFYGFEKFQAGNFASARDHFRRALASLPQNDKSFRRLHIMSLLCLTYFATGKFLQAKKFARQTLDLASLDESDRFKIRYVTLEAELLWEDGMVAESLDILHKSGKILEDNGVHTLEELSALSKLIWHTAICGQTLNVDKYHIDKQLRSNRHTWLEYEFSCALLKSAGSQIDAAISGFENSLTSSRELGALYFEALSLHGLICCYLKKHELHKVKELVILLEIAVSRLGDTPIKAKLQCIYAAISYQEGDFAKAVKVLTAVEKLASVSFPDQFAIQCCLATINGHSPKLIYEWQTELVSRFVKNYFSPTLELPEPRVFVISNHYTVNLEKHPALAELLTYLIQKPALSAMPAEIQNDVWKQSTNLQGWQQKIRNAIMRLRDLFPYTMAPILLHNDDGVRFFANAISIAWSNDSDDLPIEIKARRVFAEGPLSSQQVAEKMKISLATAKRTIRKLTDEHELTAEKIGRNVVYRALKGKRENSGDSSRSIN